MPYERFVPLAGRPDLHPSGILGCIPPLYFLVGVGSVWRCEHCGQRWERTSGPHAWSKIA